MSTQNRPILHTEGCLGEEIYAVYALPLTDTGIGCITYPAYGDDWLVPK